MKNYSEATAVEIDQEIRRIIQENYQITRKLLKEHNQQLLDLSLALLEKETLDGAEMRKIAFPAGEPAYLRPKKEEEPFKFETGQETAAQPESDPEPEEKSEC
jgi:cell division protease FtsH